MLKELNKKRKAVSPVIAVILLIGLTVLAGAVVAFVVLPMLDSPFDANDVTTSFNAASNTITITNGNTQTLDVTDLYINNTLITGFTPVLNIDASGSIINIDAHVSGTVSSIILTIEAGSLIENITVV